MQKRLASEKLQLDKNIKEKGLTISAEPIDEKTWSAMIWGHDDSPYAGG